MEDQDNCVPQDEQAIRDQIDDEIVNHELMERLRPDDERVRLRQGSPFQTPPSKPLSRTCAAVKSLITVA